MKIFNITKVALAAVAVMLTACSDKDDIITSLEYSRNFAPTSFEASVVENVKGSFTWETNATPEKYVIELYTGSEITAEALVATQDVANTFGTKANPFITDNLLPQQEYTARIKAVGNNKEDSKWAVLEESFTTKKEAEPTPQVVEVTDHLTFTEGTVAASYTVGCLTLNITDGDSKFKCDANKAYFGTATEQIQYTTRLKTGSTSGAKSFITMISTAKGKMTVSARTGSNSAVRSIVISKEGNEVAKFSMDESLALTDITIEGEETAQKVYPQYTCDIEPGTYEITYPDGSVNIYGIDVTYEEGGSSEGGDEPAGPTAEAGSVNFGTEAASITDGQQYSFGGASITINNGNGKFAIDANTQYFGDATTQTKYVTRLKSGGASGSSNGITLTLAAKGTVTIAMRSSSSSAERAVQILDATSTSVQNWTVADSNATKDVTIQGEESAKTVFNIYSVTLDEGTYTFTYDGGVNFYGFSYEPSK